MRILLNKLLNIFTFCVVLVTILTIGCMIFSALYVPKIPRAAEITTRNIIKNFEMVLMRAMIDSGQTNVMEYINNLSEAHNIPPAINSKIISLITKGFISETGNTKNGFFIDAWGNPIVINFTTNHFGKFFLTVHSFGKNKINENGRGDDIMIWLNLDMTSPELKEYDLIN